MVVALMVPAGRRTRQLCVSGGFVELVVVVGAESFAKPNSGKKRKRWRAVGLTHQSS